MINFTVGPVQSDECVREIGAQHVPYVRTPEFADVRLENERLMKKFAKAEAEIDAIYAEGQGRLSREAELLLKDGE